MTSGSCWKRPWPSEPRAPWRLWRRTGRTLLPRTPNGHLPLALALALAGKKYQATSALTLLVEELGPCRLFPVMRSTG